MKFEQLCKKILNKDGECHVVVADKYTDVLFERKGRIGDLPIDLLDTQVECIGANHEGCLYIALRRE